jgi:hypothetical protein
MADWGTSLVPFEKQSLVADGSSTGLLTIASTFRLRIGSVVYLNATGLPSVSLQIADIVNDTTFYVKLTTPGVYTRFDSSAYTVALAATITQPEQTNFFVNKDPGISDVYRILRDMRDVAGVAQGTPNSSLANGWPVKVTDGTNVLGTALNPIVVTGISGGGGGGTASSIGGGFPGIATAVGFNDGANMQGARVFDVDTGAGLQYVLGVNIRQSGSGGSVEAGIAANPFYVQGSRSNNTALGTVNVPVLNAIANTANPSYSDGNQVALSVDLNGNLRIVEKSGSTAITQVASSATNVTLKASNGARMGLTIFNDSTQFLYLKLGVTASSSSYSVKMAPNAYYEVPAGYTGQIDGIWVSANGNALVTEITN